MSLTPRQAELLRRHRRLLRSQRAACGRQLAATWLALPSIDRQHVADYEEAAQPLVDTARTAAVAEAEAFYALMLDTTPRGVDPEKITTTATLLYPFLATWRALSNGRPYLEARKVGESTARSVGRTFVQSVANETGDLVADQAGLKVRWRRVAEPNCCDWCSARDGGIYPSSSAASYGHDECHCDPVPVAN